MLGAFLTIVLLVVAYLVGGALEKSHYRDIEARETRYRTFPVISVKSTPRGWTATDAGLVSGSVVVSVDYFKRLLASIRMVFGGRLGAYETLLERARREAVLRMTEAAVARGFDAIINVRLVSSRLASSRGGGKGTAGVEILAFGTGLTLDGSVALTDG